MPSVTVVGATGPVGRRRRRSSLVGAMWLKSIILTGRGCWGPRRASATVNS